MKHYREALAEHDRLTQALDDVQRPKRDAMEELKEFRAGFDEVNQRPDRLKARFDERDGLRWLYDVAETGDGFAAESARGTSAPRPRRP